MTFYSNLPAGGSKTFQNQDVDKDFLKILELNVINVFLVLR